MVSSLTSLLACNSSSRSAVSLDGNLGLDSGDTQHDTVFPIPKAAVNFTLLQSRPKSANVAAGKELASFRHPRAVSRAGTQPQVCPFADMEFSNQRVSQTKSRRNLSV